MRRSLSQRVRAVLLWLVTAPCPVCFFGDDPAFFTNIHPNSRGMGLIADWEIETLRELFGDKLPNT